MTYSGYLRKLIPIIVLLIILCMPILVQGQVTDITASFDYSGSIKSGEVKIFHFPGNDLYLELKVTTDSAADFYIFTESGYDEYCDESAAYFHPEETAERKTSFSWSKKLTQGYYLVIDNDYVSESGTIPTGTVSYDIDVGLD
ncbi:MAG: hypothetical protein KKD98_07490, partial [Candidatus Thermoplasmatota archaeon]|nr:hypothetical protein [Candidatus Thermoplasmatota archaeon]